MLNLCSLKLSETKMLFKTNRIWFPFRAFQSLSKVGIGPRRRITDQPPRVLCHDEPPCCAWKDAINGPRRTHGRKTEGENIQITPFSYFCQRAQFRGETWLVNEDAFH